MSAFERRKLSLLIVSNQAIVLIPTVSAAVVVGNSGDVVELSGATGLGDLATFGRLGLGDLGGGAPHALVNSRGTPSTQTQRQWPK